MSLKKKTATREISNTIRDIYLFDFYKNKNEFNHQPCLVFEDIDIWNNSEYVFDFLRRLKKDKKSAVKELKQFCEENDINFEDTKEDLLDIFSDSVELNFW